MIYLLQLYKGLNNNDKELFTKLFDYESIIDDIETLDYTNAENEYINELLMNHLGIEITCEKQLSILTKSILKPNTLKTLKVIL